MNYLLPRLTNKAPKSVSKNSYPNVSEASKNENQDKVECCEKVHYLVNLQIGENISEEGFSWNSLSACFSWYMISLSAGERLKNLEAKIPHSKTCKSQNTEKP